MTSEQAHAFRERWRKVEELELQELRNSTFETRWRQFRALMSLRPYLPLPEADNDLMPVYRRWQRLKELHERTIRP